MNGKLLVRSCVLVAIVSGSAAAQPSTEWPIHAKDRPQPPVVQPGNDALPVKVPADAVVLFDGKDPISALTELMSREHKSERE